MWTFWLSELKYYILCMVGTFHLSGVNLGFDGRIYSLYWLHYYSSRSTTAFWPSKLHLTTNRNVGVMVSVLASSAVHREFEPRSGPIKNYKIGICCFSAKHAALRRKNKDWFARNQDNVSEWDDISIRGLLFQWASTIKIQLSMLV